MAIKPVIPGRTEIFDSRQINLLENLYESYNKFEYINPDPLIFLYRYENFPDREITGLIAASLAYGRVKQIMNSIEIVLDAMNPSPSLFLKQSTEHHIYHVFKAFKHRFTTGKELSAFLVSIKSAIRRYGSLQDCFHDCFRNTDTTILPALNLFIEKMIGNKNSSLLPVPGRGSACKRLNLFMRWMVRKDEVDPGGWDFIPRSKLLIPLDTHMHRLCRAMKLTSRSGSCIKTVNQVTEKFKQICPEDPVRYDFVLTHMGIRDSNTIPRFIELWNEKDN
jgi:uncharacterized protein (TIGR02757 family)